MFKELAEILIHHGCLCWIGIPAVFREGHTFSFFSGLTLL